LIDVIELLGATLFPSALVLSSIGLVFALLSFARACGYLLLRMAIAFCPFLLASLLCTFVYTGYARSGCPALPEAAYISGCPGLPARLEYA